MKRLFLTVAALLLAASAASAQTAWYVDPTTGSDGNSGALPTDPFRSLGHALTVAAAGDNVFLAGGTYGAFETFPIGLRDGVRVSALGGAPVFDGGGAALLFDLAEDITQETEVSGLTMTDAVTCVSIASGQSVDGLVFDGCEFSPTTLGVNAFMENVGGGQELTLRGCSFLATAGDTAVLLRVGAGTTLAAGGVEECEILGVFNQGVMLHAEGDGVLGTGFAVQGNEVSGCLTAIRLLAEGTGPTATPATVAAPIRANTLTGAEPAADTGLWLEADSGPAAQDARVSSRVEFNEIAGFDTALLVRTDNDGTAIADVISDFYGNLLAGAETGVSFDVTLPNPGERDADPNFGGNGDGGVACLNTFSGFISDFALDLDMTEPIFARFCWFDGAPAVADGTVDATPQYEDPLAGTVSGELLPNLAGQVLTITAGSTSGFVDHETAGAAGQIEVLLDGLALAQDDIEALPIGAGLLLTLPALAAGAHALTVTNPGGQSGEFAFNIAVPGVAGSSGCFVATAAHGDYDAPEVRELRRLRDEYLAMSGPGRSFIRWYYREGPAAADWIAERPWARAGARVALQPLVWLSGALTGWNPGQRFAFMLLCLGASFALLRRRAVAR